MENSLTSYKDNALFLGTDELQTLYPLDRSDDEKGCNLICTKLCFV